MSDTDEEPQYRPAPLPAEYVREHRANFRWLSALRAALGRGLSAEDAAAEAADAVPESLEPSRFPDRKPFRDEPGVSLERWIAERIPRVRSRLLPIVAPAGHG